MRCPKCGSRHIAAGSCVMCGAIVRVEKLLAARHCPACGRLRRYEGLCCADCGEAIALGAKSLEVAARRAYRDLPPDPGKCPVADWLERHIFRWHRKDQRYFWDLRYQYWPAERKARHMQRVLQSKRAAPSTPEARAKRNERERRWRNRPEVRARHTAARLRRYHEDPVWREQQKRRNHDYYERNREKILERKRQRRKERMVRNPKILDDVKNII